MDELLVGERRCMRLDSRSHVGNDATVQAQFIHWLQSTPLPRVRVSSSERWPLAATFSLYHIDHIDFRPMSTSSRQQKRQEIIVSSLNAAIVALDVAEKVCSITPATAAFTIVKEIPHDAQGRVPSTFCW